MAILKEMAKTFFGEFEELLLAGASKKKALLGAACVVQEVFDLYPDDPDDDDYYAGFGVAGIARKDDPENDAPNESEPPMAWEKTVEKLRELRDKRVQYVPHITPMMPVPTGAAYVVPVKRVSQVVAVEWIHFGGKLVRVRIVHDDGTCREEVGEIAVLLRNAGIGPDWYLVEMIGGVHYVSPDEFKHFVKV